MSFIKIEQNCWSMQYLWTIFKITKQKLELWNVENSTAIEAFLILFSILWSSSKKYDHRILKVGAGVRNSDAVAGLVDRKAGKCATFLPLPQALCWPTVFRHCFPISNHSGTVRIDVFQVGYGPFWKCFTSAITNRHSIAPAESAFAISMKLSETRGWPWENVALVRGGGGGSSKPINGL